MRIAVIGAAGRTGRHVVRQALGQGDDVAALVRRFGSLEMTHPRLSVTEADVRDVDSLRRALRECDAVVSAIGARPAPRVDLYSAGIANIMQAMAESDIRRLSAVSAAGAFARTHRNLTFGYKLLIRTAYRALYDDLEMMETLIAASAMEWTIARPSGLTDGLHTGDYRIGLTGQPLKAGGKISREDVAGFLLKSLKVDTWLRRAVTISE